VVVVIMILTPIFKAVACIISILAGWLSDKYKDRSMVIIIGAPVAIAGFFMLEFLPNSKPAAKYGALYLAATGYYSFYPIYLTWVS
jgi:dipeptide/tripeptide permease